MRRLLLAFLCVPVLAGAQSSAAIDSIVERALSTFNAPGAAVTVVKDGKVPWDAPVIRYLPEFAMYDPFVDLLLKPKPKR